METDLGCKRVVTLSYKYRILKIIYLIKVYLFTLKGSIICLLQIQMGAIFKVCLVRMGCHITRSN